MVHSWALALTMVSFAYAVGVGIAFLTCVYSLGLPLPTRLCFLLDCSSTFVDSPSVGACLHLDSILYHCFVGSYPQTPCGRSGFTVSPEVGEGPHCSSFQIALQIAGMFPFTYILQYLASFCQTLLGL